jgi:hypothetical protein
MRRGDETFELDRAFDLLPHVVGASWATVWFRVHRIRRPSIEEFRSKVVEYYTILDPLVNIYSKDEALADITRRIKIRNQEEIERILKGKNQEIEKRFKRYIDYG